MTINKASVYDANSIVVKGALAAIRERSGMYTDPERPNHIGQEVLDNSSDEILDGHATTIKGVLYADGSLSVEDDGRGIPFGMNDAEKQHAVVLIFTQLHSGGKFDNADGGGYKISGGLHGVGVTVTNALSEYVEIFARTDGVNNYIVFKDGIPSEIENHVERTISAESGTLVKFKPDTQYFEDVEFNKEKLVRQFRSKALLLAGAKVSLTIEDVDGGEPEVFEWCFEKSLVTYMEEELKGSDLLAVYNDSFFIPKSHPTYDNGEGVEWYLAIKRSGSRVVNSFVNIIHTSQGGTHDKGFVAGCFDAFKSYLKQSGLAPKNIEITSDDFSQHISYLLSCRLTSPKFKNQTKDALLGKESAQLVSYCIRAKFESWLMTNYGIASQLAEMVIKSASSRIRKNKAVETKRGNGVTQILPAKLSDCDSKDPEIAELFLVEGDSAGGSAKQGRDRAFQAIMPLKGKIANCWNLAAAKAMASEEVLNISIAIGVLPHKVEDDPEIVLRNCRYHNIFTLADADVDGYHIEVLVSIGLIITHFPHLITAGYYGISQSPRYRVEAKGKGKKPSISEYSKDDTTKDQLVARLISEGYDEDKIHVGRFKGLGEMNPAQLNETALDPVSRTVIVPILTCEELISARESLAKVMSDSPASMAERKAWISECADFTAYEYNGDDE